MLDFDFLWSVSLQRRSSLGRITLERFTLVKRDARTSPSSRYSFGTRSSQRNGRSSPFSSAIGCERSCFWCRDQERLGIVRRVAIDQYRTTASVAPQMSITTSRGEAVRDGT